MKDHGEVRVALKIEKVFSLIISCFYPYSKSSLGYV